MFKQGIYELKSTSTHQPGLRGCQMVGGGKMNKNWQPNACRKPHGVAAQPLII